ncbi:MAG: DNA polymerase III subunit gamma/tau [Candidatus Berkelbacteria bacterium Athens1014_28]|uniref:DNA polymerase III subunit gamma/tau n=1 Tax=Candidatus Berkelbacteria bacterium Athens1014_28 TaxID=2017145 RepID=A0A554LML7_9BACT|nr:MAG: DNA polymerase III subunit gamma/tau [Candidatus Berkelbacteria bacterium Athens1014_28]
MIPSVLISDNRSVVVYTSIIFIMPSLYRKYRPQKFADLSGEDHIRDTFLVAIKEDKISHAYLFSGPRGTGKTTVARLLAKAVNCQAKTKTGEPCNECNSCEEITLGKNLDIIEIDAASNRGIDEVRELRDKVKYAPTKSKYKVYIIDEVHMLTMPAFNALLKTLEEPPSHAIFILATTDPQKVPATILSRVIRFDFRRIDKEQIALNLKKIAESEKISAGEEIFEQLAILADGSHRDGISIFEQVSSSGKKLTLEILFSILGLSQEGEAVEIVDSVISADSDGAIKKVSNLLQSGVSAEQINKSIVGVLRRSLIYKISPDLAKKESTKEQIEGVKKFAEKISREKLNQILTIFILAQALFKETSIRSLPIEMAIVEASAVATSQVEPAKEVKIVEPKKDIVTEKKPAVEVVGQKVAIAESVEAPIIEKTVSEDLWKKILAEIKNHNHSLQALLRDAYPKGVADGKLLLGVKFKFHADKISESKNCQILESVVSEILGGKIQIACQVEEKKPKPAEKSSGGNEDLEKAAEEMFETE